MKLTASPHFPEKRIGYLGMMLLLTEDTDVLMLSTNALKVDLNSNNKFVAGLALCCIGNLATADMSRDLAPEVDKHLKSQLPYLRKKACLAMARCLSKCPEMVEDFLDHIISLLKDRTHGVLITVVQLLTQVLIIDYRTAEEEGEDPFETETRATLLKIVPHLVKMLRNLLGSGFAPDHSVSGISDPFLQVQILMLLRLLGANNAAASEEMNDVLAQVATNTETAKNAGNAILYECVQTIMGIEAEDGLRVLAVNILGRFLLNRDNNIRYVALNTLARCIMGSDSSATSTAATNANTAMAALQRHRTTVVDCLKDPDVSIRQRALELIYHLVNDSNVESLTAELLNYLVLCPREHRADICTRILRVVDRYSPDDRWRVDTLVTTLSIAGREASRDVQSATVVYVSRASSDIHAFATHKLLKALRDDDGSQHGLLSVAIWCIGEYGDLLLQPYTYTAAPPATSGENGSIDLASTPSTITFMALDPLSIVLTIEKSTSRSSCPEYVKQRALTAYVKLSERFADRGDAGAANAKLEQLLRAHRTSRSLELQLRSCEYDTLMFARKGVKPPKISVSKPADDIFGDMGESAASNGDAVSGAVQSAAKQALARMPVVDIKILQKRLSTNEGSFVGDGNDFASGATRSKLPTPAAGGDLLDLGDIFGGGSAPAAGGTNTMSSLNGTANAGTAASSKSDMDLLADIFSAQPTAPAPAAASSTNGILDLYGAPASSTPAQPLSMGLSAMPTPLNPLDLFGGTPMNPSANSNAPNAPGSVDIFSAQPSVPISTAQQQPMSGDIFGGFSTPAAAPPATSVAVKVAGPNHAGLSIEFECLKPDAMNKQKSTLIAHFSNSTGGPIVGLNFQVAVPKFVTMQMEPPSSTTVPATSPANGQRVTQKIHVTNTMLGSKNLMLKVKISFSSGGQQQEHMATCAGFPPGEY
jgi:AP-1 complex subunit gamma-1